MSERVLRNKGVPHTFMFAPHATRWCEVVYPSEILELVERCLGSWDAELMLELAGCSDADAWWQMSMSRARGIRDKSY